MKPFDLERALAGDPVVTRYGRPVTQLTLFKDTDAWPLVGIIDRRMYSFNIDGKSTGLISKDGFFDLFMAPKVQKRWVVVKHSQLSGREFVAGPYDSKAEADEEAQRCADEKYAAHVTTIEWSE